MKRMLTNGLKIFFICSVLVGFTSLAVAQKPAENPRKIIVFKEGFVNRAAQITLARHRGATVVKPLGLINGLAAHLPPQTERALLRRPEILRIEDDLVVSAIARHRIAKYNPQPAEVLPWGIDRINADLAWPLTKGLAIKVAILDTGIDLYHPDLQSNIKGNVNTINPNKSGNDDNGHGTHVAGTVAAIDNTIGVIGAGPEIYLYAVKVLNKNGSGWLSDVIEGLEWCINNNMQVVNMSLGTTGNSQAFHDAIIRVNEAGIVQVAAAGNNGKAGGTIVYPAKYPETIAVSAVDKNDNLASFSSYGPEIDLAAPGVNIKSTYKNGNYATLSGTSMATPHVTGTAALVLTRSLGSYDLDGDGLWDPVEVKNKLEDTAEDLGLSASYQGAGLVRADSAIQ